MRWHCSAAICWNYFCCNCFSNNLLNYYSSFYFTAKTWPFLVTLLTRCVTLEVNSTKKSSTKKPSSKKSLPKPSFAKILRVVLQRAENVKFPG